ncbi:MAG: phosphoglycerate mutase [Rhodobacteraceae bacterium]|nr:phosphoglycerate mutase [Paracoccaceae bacterium]
MPELIVIRHGQASFGSAEAAGYDRLSPLGEDQARMVGAALKASGLRPDRLVTGSLARQKETMALMGFGDEVEEHAGFNEYDFHDLLKVRFNGEVPAEVVGDRRAHFRTLRDTLKIWQQGGLDGARESWTDYIARVDAARAHATRPGAERVLAVSSGGTIGRLVAQAIQAPDEMMITLNLQVKNTSITRFIFNAKGRFFLNEFNATPHFLEARAARHLTYS